MFELLYAGFAVAGGLLAGVPIALHMLRRTPAVRMPFSVVRFLTPTLPKTTKRSTIEHWPLMLLRILAVILIALAFARPFQRVTIAKATESGTADRVALLIDASASMRRDGLREAVIAEIQKVVAELNEEDTLSLAVFSENARTLLSSSEWKQTEPASRAALIERVTNAYEPDWLATNTATAMLEAADEVAREQGTAGPEGERRVVLITDFQEGSDLDAVRSGTWPDSVKLDLRIVQPTASGNAGLSLAEDGRTGRIRVRVTNSGDATMTSYSLSIFDIAGNPIGKPITAEVGGGQRKTITMPEVTEGQPLIAGVEILNDAHPFDNVVDLPLEEVGVVQIAHAGPIDPNNADTMRYYLQRVLDGNETSPVEMVDLVGVDGIALPVPDNVRLAIATDTVSEGLITSLNGLLDRGGIVMIALKSTDMATSLKSLMPENTGIEEASVTDYAMLGQLDFSNSLLTPFADARFADFSSIRFWHFRKLTLDPNQAQAVRVLAKFDSGAPAILESSRPSGGRLFILTAGWHPEDSQWALSTRFPPMIHRLVQLANPRKSGHLLFEAGQRISPADLSGSEKWTLTAPDGTVQTPSTLAAKASTSQPINLSAESSAETTTPGDSTKATEASPASAASDSQMISLSTPGRWTLTGETAEGPKSVSLLVTVAASESRTEPFPAGQLQALGMSSDVATVKTAEAEQPSAAETAQLDSTELESQQKFWRWFLLAGLILLAIESIVAATIERRRRLIES
ncbi:MAG: BatA domain-containing protein [Planctomycetales bacterium]|jgi:hypothetical protein|nr:BatA domain-containing protein [Planctomycetales bacterium]